MNLRRDSKDPFVHRLEYRSLADGIRLPLNRTIIGRFMCLREENKLISSKDVNKTIVSEVEEIWRRAFIPIKSTKSVISSVTLLHQKWESMKKYGAARLQQPNEQLTKKISEFQNLLDQLFDIASEDAFEQLKSSRLSTWKEDWEFLLNQRNSRTGYMAGVDRETVKLAERTARRVHRTQQSQQGRQSTLTESEIENILGEESSDESEETHENYMPIPKKRKETQESACLVVPTSTLLHATSEVSDRCGISIRDQLLMTSRIVNVGGGNIENFTLSVTSAWRQRNEAREQLAEKIKEKWLLEERSRDLGFFFL